MKNKGLIKLAVVLMATVVFAVFVFFQSPVSNIDRENITNISYAHGAGPQWQSLYVLQDKESINAVADALEQLDLSFAIPRETGAELLKNGEIKTVVIFIYEDAKLARTHKAADMALFLNNGHVLVTTYDYKSVYYYKTDDTALQNVLKAQEKNAILGVGGIVFMAE